ncbi:MAG: serine hydrolase [Alphaproteobacteria bacterium]|nr:serine hydrolase [Alphaproteobacteria bacterium]
MVGKSSIDAALRAATESGAIAGVVAMATSAAATLYQGSFGTADLATGAPMRPDAIFRLASMTKAITSVAAMQLVEQGRLSLDAPIARCSTVSPMTAPRACARPPAR